MNDTTQIWTEKYQPTKLQDLIVNKDKIIQIKKWLETFNDNNSKNT